MSVLEENGNHTRRVNNAGDLAYQMCVLVGKIHIFTTMGWCLETDYYYNYIQVGRIMRLSQTSNYNKVTV